VGFNRADAIAAGLFQSGDVAGWDKWSDFSLYLQGIYLNLGCNDVSGSDNAV
jgi:hypothetical protein